MKHRNKILMTVVGSVCWLAIAVVLIVTLAAPSAGEAAAKSNVQQLLDKIPAEQTLYEWAYANATEEQKVQLEAIQAERHGTPKDQWTRRILIAIDALSPNTPRLTLEVAQTLGSQQALQTTYKGDTNAFESNVIKAFNAIAGAPDWEGGSGIYRYCYYLNEEQTQAIYVMLGRVIYVEFEADGSRKAGKDLTYPEANVAPSVSPSATPWAPVDPQSQPLRDAPQATSAPQPPTQ